MSMQRKMLLFVSAFLLCGPPAFAQNAADLEAAFENAKAVHEANRAARDQAQTAVENAKVARDLAKEDRQAAAPGTPEREAAVEDYNLAVASLRQARTVRDSAQEAFKQSKEALQAAVAALNASTESAPSELEQAQADLAAAQADLAQAYADLAEVQAKLTQGTAALDRAQADLAAAQEEIKRQEGKVIDAESRLVELEAEHEAEMEAALEEAELAAVDHIREVTLGMEKGCIPQTDANAPGGLSLNTPGAQCISTQVIYGDTCIQPGFLPYPFPDAVTLYGTSGSHFMVASAHAKRDNVLAGKYLYDHEDDIHSDPDFLDVRHWSYLPFILDYAGLTYSDYAPADWSAGWTDEEKAALDRRVYLATNAAGQVIVNPDAVQGNGIVPGSIGALRETHKCVFDRTTQVLNCGNRNTALAAELKPDVAATVDFIVGTFADRPVAPPPTCY